MEILNTQATDIKKVWEAPAVVEISKETILGTANVGADAGTHT